MAKQSGKSFRSFLGVEPSKPTTKDSVLVIVDAQNEYDHGLLAISDVKSSRAIIGDVLKKYRDANGDVVHVRHSTPDGAPLFTPKTELAEEFEELTQGAGASEKVVHKQHPSSFTGTDLHEHLDKLGKKKIAHVCISNTSRAGAELGYDVSVLADGIGDRDIPGASAKQLVDTTLAELGDVSATVIHSEDL
ncbi:hypothetical protein HO133_006819 [Letharia lupina]|uniref:Isochorismatase-like domain-containing protein n=1 Tax=Letharia lupina TaxID=560253 RepID=A0A8H6C6E9_9LECA|nr:uncharacterized protein HO133_006819 [Letharia lupina]KAF6217481.1 hypothetical protein HO133_006819 [Letharia lupina]